MDPFTLTSALVGVVGGLLVPAVRTILREIIMHPTQETSIEIPKLSDSLLKRFTAFHKRKLP